MRCRATGEAPGLGQVGEDRNKGKFQLIAFIGISVRKARQIRVKSLDLDNYRKAWAIGWCLAGGTGPGMTWSLFCEK